MDSYFFYVVVFRGTHSTDGPIISYLNSQKMKEDSNNTMHLFDDEINKTLSAIEHIMHLPRIKFDLFDLHEKLISSSHDTPHIIIVLSEDLVSEVLTFGFKPTMFILTDDCDVETKSKCNRFNSILGSYYSNELNKIPIKNMWNFLWMNCKAKEFNKVDDIDVHFKLDNDFLKALPILFRSRQLGIINDVLSKIFNTNDFEKECLEVQWKNAVNLKALVSLNNQGVTPLDYDEKKYINLLSVEARKFDISVIVTFPGVSKLQLKYGLAANELSENEKRAIRIMGVHRAIARDGILMELPKAKEELFVKFDELEQRCKEGTNNKYIWRELKSIGKLLKNYFNKDQLEALKRAKDITVFSDIPIGLAILEGEEVPLLCYKNISYRPLTPLTRQFEIEMIKSNQHYLGKNCKVAMAQCIFDDDDNKYVYQASELLYTMLKDMIQKYKGLTVIHEHTYSVNSIKKFIEKNKDADILYISAHGRYSKKTNMAGIMVGNEFWMASEDIKVQPVVILSACHVSPRGVGAVNIADLLIRNGANVVLGTFIPVNAMRNTILMTRLFTYICEAQTGSQQYKSLDEAWCGIVATNAIHELMESSDGFNRWMHTKNSQGKPRILEFQLERCVGRLRSTHIYSDTINIVKEMLDEEGLQGKFFNGLDMNDFFPESFFYQLIGYPENVFLYNEIFDKACTLNIF